MANLTEPPARPVATPTGPQLVVPRAIPDGARGSITLLSDGFSTSRDWGPAVQDLTARGLPVHTVALDSRAVTPERALGI